MIDGLAAACQSLSLSFVAHPSSMREVVKGARPVLGSFALRYTTESAVCARRCCSKGNATTHTCVFKTTHLLLKARQSCVTLGRLTSGAGRCGAVLG